MEYAMNDLSKLTIGFSGAVALSACATTSIAEQLPECPYEVRGIVRNAASFNEGVSRSTTGGQAIELELKSGQRCVVSFP